LRLVEGGLSVRFWYAIKEYPTIWVAETCTDFNTGFLHNRPGGLAIPSEAEATCFTHILESSWRAAEHRLSVNEFVERYDV
jgi:hypothetical protein